MDFPWRRVRISQKNSISHDGFTFHHPALFLSVLWYCKDVQSVNYNLYERVCVFCEVTACGHGNTCGGLYERRRIQYLFSFFGAVAQAPANARAGHNCNCLIVLQHSFYHASHVTLFMAKRRTREQVLCSTDTMPSTLPQYTAAACIATAGTMQH